MGKVYKEGVTDKGMVDTMEDTRDQKTVRQNLKQQNDKNEEQQGLREGGFVSYEDERTLDEFDGGAR